MQTVVIPRINLRELLEPGSVPEVDFQWEPFKAHMDAFLVEIDGFFNRSKDKINEMAKDFNDGVSEKRARMVEEERAIRQEQEEERLMLQTMEEERKGVSQLTSQLASLQTSLNKVREQTAALDSELHAIRGELRAERAVKERQGRSLAEHRAKDEREIETLQSALGLTISGVGSDRLLILFTLIDAAKPLREFSFVIDVSAAEFRVPQCDPPIATMPDLVKQLNSDRDFSGFIKRVRKGFVALVSPPGKSDDVSGHSRRPSLAASQRRP